MLPDGAVRGRSAQPAAYLNVWDSRRSLTSADKKPLPKRVRPRNDTQGITGRFRKSKLDVDVVKEP